VYDGIKTRFGEMPLGLDTPAVVAAAKSSSSSSSERLYPAPSAKGYQPIVREHPWSLHILSAMVAGATSTICTNPLWVIKTRFMVRARPYYPFRLSIPSPYRRPPIRHNHVTRRDIVTR
jgi:solute carrier family 25 (mitochondrial folate transporter), member 32